MSLGVVNSLHRLDLLTTAKQLDGGKFVPRMEGSPPPKPGPINFLVTAEPTTTLAEASCLSSFFLLSFFFLSSFFLTKFKRGAKTGQNCPNKHGSI